MNFSFFFLCMVLNTKKTTFIYMGKKINVFTYVNSIFIFLTYCYETEYLISFLFEVLMFNLLVLNQQSNMNILSEYVLHIINNRQSPYIILNIFFLPKLFGTLSRSSYANHARLLIYELRIMVLQRSGDDG